MGIKNFQAILSFNRQIVTNRANYKNSFFFFDSRNDIATRNRTKSLMFRLFLQVHETSQLIRNFKID